MKYIKRHIVGIILLFSCITYAENEVYLDFFYSPGCAHCEEVTAYVTEITDKYHPFVITNIYNTAISSNYILLTTMEQAINVIKNEPLVIFAGSNHLHGAQTILKGLDKMVSDGIAMGGIPSWRPANISSAPEAIERRFKSFTCLVITGAGLADGINPCAFATLVLFASMLACYRKTRKDLFVTTGIFALAVGITYALLGLLFFSAFRILFDLSWLRLWLHTIMGGLCIVFALLSLRDAWKQHVTKDPAQLFLKLPDSIRTRIHTIFHNYTGRRIVITGIFMAGVMVPLMESVCTGQLYIPTLAFMAKQSETQLTAAGMLILYNVMFVVPLFILAIAVSYGLHAMFLTKLMKKNIIPGLLIQSIVFIVIGVLLFITI
jgi:cytochrome c biogenesis protein CcdA